MKAQFTIPKIEKEGIKKVAKYLILLLILAIFTFPDYNPQHSKGIDESLVWVYNYFFDGNMSLGKDITFPHGPLAFLMYPLPMGNNLIIVALFEIFLKGIIFGAFLSFFHKRKADDFLSAFFICLLLFHILSVQLLLIGAILSLLLHYFASEKWGYPLLSFTLAALAIYIKSYVGILSATIICSFLVIDLIYYKKYKRSIAFGLYWLSMYFVFWLLLYNSSNGFIRFFYGLKELASDNSAAAAFYPQNNWGLLFTSITCFLLLPILQRDKRVLIYYGITALAVFAAWKHGMAREDVYHARSFFIFLCMFFALLFAFVEKIRFRSFVLATICLGAFYCNLPQTPHYKELSIGVIHVNLLSEFIFNYEGYAQKYNSKSAANIEEQRLDSNILKLIGNRTVDIYPWEYSYIPANKLNWQPRPALHSYAAYSSWLDLQDCLHFYSDKAPDFFLLELEKKSKDLYGGKLEGADHRYLLNDEPQTMIAVFQNYKLVYRNEKICLFEKKKDKSFAAAKIVARAEVSLNEQIELPKMDKNGVLRAKIDMKKSPLAKLQSFFWKDEEAFVTYFLENGEAYTYKIVPKNVKDGIWVHPFIMRPDEATIESAVKSIKIHSSSKEFYQDKIQIEWEFYPMLSANSPYSLFNKTEEIKDKLILSTSNSMNELPPNDGFWSGHKEQIQKSDFFSAPSACKIKPEGYSIAFSMNADSLFASPNLSQIEINCAFWFNTILSTRAQLIVSIEAKGETLFWESVPLHYFQIGRLDWNTAVTKKIIAQNDKFLKEGKRLSIYVWNSSETSFLLDDFNIRIEQIKKKGDKNGQ